MKIRVRTTSGKGTLDCYRMHLQSPIECGLTSLPLITWLQA
nr:MAG TPA: hypothetical protein [Caudoviricetes sp.]